MTASLKIMFVLWQAGLVDSFSMIQFCINSGSQYGAIVVASAAGNFSDINPKVLLEPLFGLHTGYQFIKAAQSEAERRARIATMAAFLSTFATSAITRDPATNAAVGGAISSNISYMRAMLTRGGASCDVTKTISSLKDFTVISNSIKNPILEIHPYRAEFNNNSKIIIDNMLQQHTVNRCIQAPVSSYVSYAQGSVQKIKTVAPTCCVTPLVSNQIKTTTVISLSYFSVGIISFTILGSFCLYRYAKRKRCQNKNNKILIQNNEILIDVMS